MFLSLMMTSDMKRLFFSRFCLFVKKYLSANLDFFKRPDLTRGES